MSLLARFEAFMEQIVETSVARFFKSPIDISTLSRRLERTMEANQIVEGNRIRVPHTYHAYLNPAEYATYRQRHARIERELTQYLLQLAVNRGFYTSQELKVYLRTDASVKPSAIRIDIDMAGIGANDITAGSPIVGGTSEHDVDRPTQIHTAPERISHQTRYYLEVTINDTVQKVPIKTTEVTIGRGPGNNLILPDHQVSRNHARINYHARSFVLSDLASRNGTFVNDKRMDDTPVTLVPNSKQSIRIGSYSITLRTES